MIRWSILKKKCHKHTMPRIWTNLDVSFCKVRIYWLARNPDSLVISWLLFVIQSACLGSLATVNAGSLIPIRITSINSLMPTEHTEIYLVHPCGLQNKSAWKSTEDSEGFLSGLRKSNDKKTNQTSVEKELQQELLESHSRMKLQSIAARWKTEPGSHFRKWVGNRKWLVQVHIGEQKGR